MDIKIITGLSGAGKSTAIKSLEDLGFYCIDNLPPALVVQFIEMCDRLKQPIDKVALGIDARSYAFFDDVEIALAQIKELYPDSAIVFLEASDHALIKRYKETRRSHPLNVQGSLIDGINQERQKMVYIKNMASLIIDTSDMTGRQLGHTIKMSVTNDVDFKQIAITFQSFGFKKGLPLDSDLVFDVRFLPNPYYEDRLRALTGNDKVIQEYVFKWYETRLFYTKLRDMLDFLLPQYVREGKNNITISIGCTGGKHRSVSICNRLASDYEGLHYIAIVKHRDMK